LHWYTARSLTATTLLLQQRPLLNDHYVTTAHCNYLQLLNENKAHSQLHLSSADFATRVIIGCCRTCSSNAFFNSVNSHRQQVQNEHKYLCYLPYQTQRKTLRQLQTDSKICTSTSLPANINLTQRTQTVYDISNVLSCKKNSKQVSLQVISTIPTYRISFRLTLPLQRHSQSVFRPVYLNSILFNFKYLHLLTYDFAKMDPTILHLFKPHFTAWWQQTLTSFTSKLSQEWKIITECRRQKSHAPSAQHNALAKSLKNAYHDKWRKKLQFSEQQNIYQTYHQYHRDQLYREVVHDISLSVYNRPQDQSPKSGFYSALWESSAHQTGTHIGLLAYDPRPSVKHPLSNNTIDHIIPNDNMCLWNSNINFTLHASLLLLLLLIGNLLSERCLLMTWRQMHNYKTKILNTNYSH